MRARKVLLKPEWLKRPVFRSSVHTVNLWVKLKTESKLLFRPRLYNRLSLGAASDAVRDQILRYDPLIGA